MSSILLIIGILVFSWGCRSFQNRYVNKAGWLALLAATYLGGYFFSNSHIGGATALAMWLIFPWLGIVTRVRKLRFPIRHELKHRFPPPKDIFPDLDEITDEVEEAGFEKTDDAGWKWESADHFVRLFYHADKKLQANISVSQQDGFVFSYASLTTRTADGHSFVTTNYPFSFTMKTAPLQQINRSEDADSFEEMLSSHDEFLDSLAINSERISVQDPELLPTTVSQELSQQIDHNLLTGVIVRLDEHHFRYSWRGCVFLWLQMVKDMIRV
ncbi:hypothetical protein FEM03_08545 [Phragmitibacter flavus]|uniref:DUF3137 domain-containing protein n=1 Tax=Phragmitibacter flavus TaxID=2576071 RepID=A0A5R8KF78_9BACT|nr:hypothetical protein [Phragmitibacter flavus]TLD70958.1 hypothetical protein FEM03_08545 [Phragmitibacter flavus]